MSKILLQLLSNNTELFNRAVVVNLLLGEVTRIPHPDFDYYSLSADNSAKITRKDAIDAFLAFPDFLMIHSYSVPKKKEKEVLKIAKLVFEHIGRWLLCWENEVSTVKLSQDAAYKSYEAKALLCESRYKMIRGMRDIWNVPGNISTASLWLWCEACEAKKDVEGSLKTKSMSSRKYYHKTKKHINELNNFEYNDEIEVGINYYFSNMDLIVDDVAKSIAIDNSNFDKEYFRPYIKAKKHWNSKTNGRGVKPLVLNALKL